MAGQEDWDQRRVGEGVTAMNVYVHKPCGSLIDMPLTSVHAKVCPANKLTESA